MAHPTYPKTGARFELTRQSTTTNTAEYQVVIHISKQNYIYQAQLIVEPREIELFSKSDPPEEWVLQHARALLRQCIQQAQRKGSWPRRIRRWKSVG